MRPASSRVLYTSDVDDNRRWGDLVLREGDVVVSTRSKHGTTWTQLICLLLVGADDATNGSGGSDGSGRTGELPEPLGRLSPWVDHVAEPVADLQARLDARPGRRVLKTHTPLDGVGDPDLDPRAVYVVVGRHPLDAAASLYHQSDNMDRAAVAALLGEDPPPPRTTPRPAEADWVRDWAVDDSSPQAWTDAPLGVVHHVHDAWLRRPGGPLAGEARVVLVHYADLLADPRSEVRRLAGELGVDPADADDDRMEQIVAATGFDAMRERADVLAPDPHLFHSTQAFFRSGGVARGRDLLTDDEQAAFEARCRSLAPDDVVDWLLR